MKFWLLTWPWNQVQKPVMLEDYFQQEKEKEQKQQPAPAEVAITNNGQQNQPNCPSICILLAAKEMAQFTRRDVGLGVVPCFAEYHTKVNL